MILFDELVTQSFFQQHPETFWFVYGDLMNKYARAEPHTGFNHLKEIISLAGKDKKHWVYHSGIDSLYEQSGFKNVMQAKGCLFDWQCKNCAKLVRVMPKQFSLDRIRGVAENIPLCDGCGKVMRPNINMRGDLDWDDKKAT